MVVLVSVGTAQEFGPIGKHVSPTDAGFHGKLVQYAQLGQTLGLGFTIGGAPGATTITYDGETKALLYLNSNAAYESFGERYRAFAAIDNTAVAMTVKLVRSTAVNQTEPSKNHIQNVYGLYATTVHEWEHFAYSQFFLNWCAQVGPDECAAFASCVEALAGAGSSVLWSNPCEEMSAASGTMDTLCAQVLEVKANGDLTSDQKNQHIAELQKQYDLERVTCIDKLADCLKCATSAPFPFEEGDDDCGGEDCPCE